MHCEFVNPLCDPEWNRLLAVFPGATFFHTAEWARVLTKAYRYDLEYAAFKDRETPIAIIPLMDIQSPWTGKRGVSLPFSDECAPLHVDGISLADVMEPIREFGARHGWRYVELRGGGTNCSAAIPSDEFAVHTLDIESSEELQQKKLQDSHRRNIQKSLREAVVVEHLRTLKAIDVFYTMHCQTRRRHGLPPQPARFFHLLQRIVLEPGHGFVSLARLGGRWIAGAVFLRFGSRAIYKFGASDPGYQQLRANNLVMWEAITRLRGEGASELSFGRTDLNDAGLLRFKRGWGTRESLLRYHRIYLHGGAESRPATSAGRLYWGAEIVKRTPIPLLRLVGALAYRHMG